MMPANAHAQPASDGVVLLHHAGCAFLVVAFVHLYGLYQVVDRQFGGGFIDGAPLALPLLFIVVLLFYRNRDTARAPLRRGPVVLGLGCCIAALAVPDPEIAVKRIHVMEYLLLSLYVRYTLAFRLSGTPLFVFSCLLSCLYGVHDELLQGIHPARTYGLRDMLVNGVASVGGGLIWHGLGLFSGRSAQAAAWTGWPRPRILYLAGLAAAVPAMAVPLVAYRHDLLPAWPFLPLAAAMVIGSCYGSEERSALRHGLLPVGAVAFLFLLYPFAVNGLQITFH